jgi:methionine synthase / methylenetetrahydrofolate reductase(NADPH)
MRRPFLEALDERVLVCDGAMGTMLYAKGVFLNRSFDELNLTQPDLVAEVHQAYVRAGADVLETNTFGANRVKLAPFGLAERLHAINAQGARIARHAARDHAYVAGAIGPLGIRVEPWGKTGLDEAEGWFREQAQALLDGGVDLFLLETFRDINEIGAAIRAVRSVCALPVVAQVTTEEDGNSLDGAPPEAFAPRLEAFGADVLGLNCSVGPAAMLETLERLAQVTSRKLSAQPNAGRPRDVDGRNLYLCSPEYMASYARRFILNGVKLVGGCCGTTPEHIRQIRLAVRAMAPGAGRPARPSVQVVEPQVAPAPAIPRAEKSRLGYALGRGEFVTIVSVRPPKGHRFDDLVELARQLRLRGVDALQLAEGSRASARMSPLSAAVLVAQQAGIESLLHYTCRDRRLLGMQTDLLGAHAMGIRNVLVTTGDPARMGDYQDATAVFDVDSIGLTNVLARLNQGLDIAGQSVGSPTAFHVGVAANPSALNLDDELRRFRYKVEAGAEFVVTEPVFDAADFERFIGRAGDVPIPVIVTVRPFESLREAEFLANEVPGMRVPEHYLERIREADAAGQGSEEGLAIAREVVEALRPLAQGIRLYVPPGRSQASLRLLDAVRAVR